VLHSWLAFLIYGFFALAIPTSMGVMSFVFATRPHRRTRGRTLPFESGVSTGSPDIKHFTISFYLTAMLFIVFDIEIVFLYPLAVVFHQLAWFGFVEFFFFIVILAVAYVYIWRKGALEWR
jgi:NADH:ubiquinone oxidoreductase subunit 3 (subunit A)